MSILLAHNAFANYHNSAALGRSVLYYSTVNMPLD
jgi:hypothetical protein